MSRSMRSSRSRTERISRSCAAAATESWHAPRRTVPTTSRRNVATMAKGRLQPLARQVIRPMPAGTSSDKGVTLSGILGKKRAPARPLAEGRAGACRTSIASGRKSVDDRHAAPVLGPGRLGRADDRRTFLAVADRRDASGRDAEGNEDVLHRGGAALAQRQIVFARAAFVAMALDRDRHV